MLCYMKCYIFSPLCNWASPSRNSHQFSSHLRVTSSLAVALYKQKHIWLPSSGLSVGSSVTAWFCRCRIPRMGPSSPICLLAHTFSVHKWGHCENLYRRVYGHIFLFTWVMYMYVYFSHIHTCIYIHVINKSRTSRSFSYYEH